MLVERIKKILLEFKQPRLQESGKAFYASEVCKDARDLYWRMTGEPATNPTDLLGAVRMFLGKAIEDGINTHIIQNLHWYGLHPYLSDEQIRVGFTEDGVSVSGKLDGMLVERRGDVFSDRPWILEIKVKNGYGADLFSKDLDPSPAYMAQMGSYLKRASEKKITNRGLFLFVLNSDKSLGEMWEIHCEYDEASGVVTATRGISLQSGEERELSHTFDMAAGLKRLGAISEAIAKMELPPEDKKHKYPVTAELLASLSDTNLRKMVDGVKVLGDWEIAYSSYKQKHLDAQGGGGYTPAEMQLIHDEYKTRFPQGRKVAGGKKSAA